MEGRECVCIKCKKTLFTTSRKEVGSLWNINGYKNDAVYLPNVGWLCLNHFSEEGIVHEIDVKYYSAKIYFLNQKVYVDEKLTFRDDNNLRVYTLKPSIPVAHFWGSYEEIKGYKEALEKTEKREPIKNRLWIL